MTFTWKCCVDRYLINGSLAFIVYLARYHAAAPPELVSVWDCWELGLAWEAVLLHHSELLR